jgi:heme-degrading monooxygenase HmoA
VSLVFYINPKFIFGGCSMISRIWHGWTNQENADAYENLLHTEIFSNIAARSIQGYHGIHLLRREVEDGVEFATIMWFDSLDAVRTFAGEDYEAAVVPAAARLLLSRFDDRSAHYQVLETPD